MEAQRPVDIHVFVGFHAAFVEWCTNRNWRQSWARWVNPTGSGREVMGYDRVYLHYGHGAEFMTAQCHDNLLRLRAWQPIPENYLRIGIV